MVQIIYTREAVEDLQRLRSFIAEKNPSSAQRIAQELIRCIKVLQDMPMIGYPVSSAPDSEIIRDWCLEIIPFVTPPTLRHSPF